jgi:phage major head subunit gpT-like protein
MDITAPNLNLFFTQLETRYSLAYETVPTWHSQIATDYPATTEAWATGWLGMLDKLRVWKGSRVTRQPAPQTYSATILPFELTESVDKFKLQDDTYGIYFPMFAHMGEMSAKWPDYSIRDLIEASGDFASTATQLGTDGVAHWSNAHPIDYWDAAEGTYVNDYGSAGTSINGITVGGTFSTNAFATVWQDMADRKGENGEKLGLQPDLTMVSTQNKFAASAVIQSQMFAPPVLGGLGVGAAATANAPFVGAMDNPLRGSTDLFVNFDLTSAVAWYMLTTKRVIKPFGWVLRQAPILIPRQDPSDPVVFDQHKFVFGVEARGVPVWSLPWLSSRSGI